MVNTKTVMMIAQSMMRMVVMTNIAIGCRKSCIMPSKLKVNLKSELDGTSWIAVIVVAVVQTLLSQSAADDDDDDDVLILT